MIPFFCISVSIRYDDVRLALIEIVTSICKEYHLREENDGAEARIAESALELLSHEKIPLSPSDKITLLQDVNKFAFREGATVSCSAGVG